MKIITVFLVLLLSFGLCSCSNTLPEEISTKEPTDTETTIPEKIIVEEPIGIEAVSVLFMGETITAPNHYPSVPDLYIPVLNDLYLCSALSQRYSKLVYEDKWSQEMLREYEVVHNEIRQRGYLPYPGDGSGSGYALVDLDGDGSPELLILHKFTYDIRKPEIKSVFAIRNERLVCIDNGSSELNYTILAADGTFYQCIDWRGAGYVNLSAFYLEAEMSEFTVISEARTALSFSDGDVPVPYWLKIENGNEIKITEDEFDVLLEQYKNPKDQMILAIVPFHPDVVDPWSIPRPTDEPPTILIEYPV